MNSKRILKGALVVALLVATQAFVGTAMAATFNSFTDGLGEHVVMQAEDGALVSSFAGEGWEVINVATASGGQAIRPTATTVKDHGVASGVANYDIHVNGGGAYSLYLLMTLYDTDSDGVYGDNDSFYTPTADAQGGTAFAAAPTFKNDSYNFGSGAGGTLASWLDNDFVSPREGIFKWPVGYEKAWNFSAPFGNHAIYNISAGADLTLPIGTREPGVAFDAFVLSTNPNLTVAQLGQLIAPVPEPTSLALLALGVLATSCGMRRR